MDTSIHNKLPKTELEGMKRTRERGAHEVKPKEGEYIGTVSTVIPRTFQSYAHMGAE